MGKQPFQGGNNRLLGTRQTGFGVSDVFSCWVMPDTQHLMTLESVGMFRCAPSGEGWERRSCWKLSLGVTLPT